MPIDFEALKARQQAMWATGDFAMIGWHTMFPGELACEAADLRAGERVIDLATGSGNVALAAARRNCAAVGIDFVPALVERARERAAAERLPARFEVADCERVPFPDASFDVVFSVFGSMFAPDAPRAAAEILRLCRPGGRVVMANWVPEGFWGEAFALQARHAPPPAGVQAPTEWGRPQRLRALFGEQLGDLQVTPRSASFRFRDNAHWLAVFGSYFGPVMSTAARLDEAARQAYLDGLDALLTRFNRATDGSLVVSADYIEVVAPRR